MQTFSCAKVTKIMGAPAKVCGLIYYTFRLFVLCKIENEKTKEYIALATCILPERMLDWFNREMSVLPRTIVRPLSTYTSMKTRRLRKNIRLIGVVMLVVVLLIAFLSVRAKYKDLYEKDFH